MGCKSPSTEPPGKQQMVNLSVAREERMRVALYGRVSTAEQNAAMQIEELRAYCGRRQWEIAEEFIDSGVSGSKESRPALNRLLADAKRRRFDAVLVYRYDRFARSLRQLVNA